MGLVMSVKKEKTTKNYYARTWRGPRQSRMQHCRGMHVLVCDQCHVPVAQHLNLSCRSLKPEQAHNIKVQTSHLVNTI